MSSFPRLVLKSGKDRAVRNRHPWIFSGAVKDLPKAGAGDIIAIYTTGGEMLGLGHFSPGKTLICRMFEFCANEFQPDKAYWQTKLNNALAYRREFIDTEQTNGFRLVHAEGDGLPGVIIDLFGSSASVQLRTDGALSLEGDLLEWLNTSLSIDSVFVSRDKDSGEWVSRGNGENMFIENGYRFKADIEEGQKTGFFLDQRDNRLLLKEYSKDKQVLNAFSYSGAFSVYAMAGGAAAVTSVDISARACALADEHVTMNFPGDERHRSVKADCFKYLNDMQDGQFDLVILDPPAFTKHISTVKKAARGYKDINMRAISKIAAGGFLFTFSCSQHISVDLFRKIVFGAAADAGRSVRIVRHLGQAPDHPVDIFHPEGEYLKGLLLYVS